MSDWTRNDSIELGRIAYQVGLSPDSAEKALTLGARFYAQGFLDYEINEMIEWQYLRWSEAEKAVAEGTATLDQRARNWKRKQRND